jgi:hypothetical protein
MRSTIRKWNTARLASRSTISHLVTLGSNDHCYCDAGSGLHSTARDDRIMPSGAACDSEYGDDANLFSSGIMSAEPIGVNAAMTSPQAAAAANQAANVDPPSNAQKVANTFTKISALVGAAISQNTFEM